MGNTVLINAIFKMEDEFPINQKMKDEAQREWNWKRFIGDHDETQLPKQHLLVEQQQRSIQVILKSIVLYIPE